MKTVAKLIQHRDTFSVHMSHDVFELVSNIQHAIWRVVEVQKNILIERVGENETSNL